MGKDDSLVAAGPAGHTPTTFQHDPLDHTTYSIRLIQVLPERSSNGLIQCIITCTTIEAKYTCLSYVWGPPDPPAHQHKISINNKLYPVRKNLWEFLEVARKKYTMEYFWIDALCIDQENTNERNHQVQQMGNIYIGREVIAWLGNEPGIVRFFSDLLGATQPIGVDSALFRTDSHSFFENEYWMRAWITQEVELASSVRVLAVTTEMTVSTMFQIWQRLGEGIVRQLARTRGYFFSHFRRYTMITPGAFSANLMYLLYEFRKKRSTIPRDRIYSLLTLFDEGSQLKVDYSISNAQLLVQVLQSFPRTLCCCTVSLVAETLGMLNSPNHGNDTCLQKYGLEFTATSILIDDTSEEALNALTTGYHTQNRAKICPTCGWRMPSEPATEAERFCFRYLCSVPLGHLFLEDSRPPQSILEGFILRRFRYYEYSEGVHECNAFIKVVDKQRRAYALRLKFSSMLEFLGYEAAIDGFWPFCGQVRVTTNKWGPEKEKRGRFRMVELLHPSADEAAESSHLQSSVNMQGEERATDV